MRYAISILLTLAGHAADWPQWRGPNRDGKSTETGLLKEWPAGGPKLIWKTQGLGAGYASLSVVQGRIYTLGQHDETQFIMALDAATGKKLWETPNGGAYHERRGDGPRGAPTIEGDRLWAMTADGTVSCLDIKTGKKIWSQSSVKDYGGSVPNWGYSESPLIDGERLIFVTGGSGSAIVAIDKSTGKLVWKSQGDHAAYSSAMIADTGRIRQVLAFTSRGAVGVRADNGELLWRYDRIANRTANIATPIFHNGHAFFSSDYGTGCVLLKLDAGGKADEVYFNGEMKNHYSTSVLVDDHLYGYSSAILTAMKFMTGEVAWKNRSVGKGSVIYADGHLYANGENGTVGLIEATPAGYKEKSRFSYSKGDLPTWAVPAISNGHLYIRDQDTLYAHAIQ